MSTAFHFDLKIDRPIVYRSNLTLYPNGYFIPKLVQYNASLSLLIFDLYLARTIILFIEKKYYDLPSKKVCLFTVLEICYFENLHSWIRAGPS